MALLFKACATGQQFPTATLNVRRAGVRSDVYLTYTMEDVLVSSYQVGGTQSGNSPASVSDSFSLNFARMTVTFVPQRPDGRPGDPVTATFNFATLQS